MDEKVIAEGREDLDVCTRKARFHTGSGGTKGCGELGSSGGPNTWARKVHGSCVGLGFEYGAGGWSLDLDQPPSVTDWK